MESEQENIEKENYFNRILEDLNEKRRYNPSIEIDLNDKIKHFKVK